LELIAQQNAELEQLRQQLQIQASLSTPAPQEDVENNETVQKLLSEKEELLKGKELELEKLRQHMEELQAENDAAQKEIPSIVVSGGEDSEKEQNDEIAKRLTEKEQLLESKERELADMRLRLEQEQAEAAKPALAEVQEQLEQLKSQVWTVGPGPVHELLINSQL
jgi:hypothetical protein